MADTVHVPGYTDDMMAERLTQVKCSSCNHPIGWISRAGKDEPLMLELPPKWSKIGRRWQHTPLRRRAPKAQPLKLPQLVKCPNCYADFTVNGGTSGKYPPM